MAKASSNSVEMDILKAARDNDGLGFPGDDNTKVWEYLEEKYPERSGDRLTVSMMCLVDSGHLQPQRDDEGRVLTPYARGITLKGEQRLHELEHPIAAWVKANWFSAGILAVTALVGVGTIVSNVF